MDDSSKVDYSQIFSLTELISAPLIAAVQGDFYAAERFVTYLRQYAFEPPPERRPWDFGKLRMVIFQYRTAEGWVEMQIPLLSLIPMPLLSVSDAEFHYNLKLLGLVAPASQNASRDPVNLLQAPLGSPVEPGKIMGTFAPLRPQTETRDETPTLTANMDISIRMRQADLPAGIATMLNVVQSSVAGSTRNRIALAPGVTALTTENPAVELRIALFDRDGQPLPSYLFRIAAEPVENTAWLLPPELVKGTLITRPGEFVLDALTDAEGVAGVRWQRGAAPKEQADVTVTASAEMDFPGNQFGPVKATALLQILPSNPTIARTS